MMVWLEPMIEKVLAWSIVVRELLKSLAIVRGYTYEDKGGQSLFGDLTYEATEAEEAIKSVKTTLLGFDKLNVLGSTDGSTFGADYSMLTDEIGKYKTSLDETANSANKLANSIMTSLGYTKEGSQWAKDTEKSFSGLSSILLGVGSTIALVFGGKGILSGATKIFTTISTKLGGIKNYFATFIGQLKDSGKLLKFGIVGGIIALFITLLNYSERFRTSVGNLINSILVALMPIVEILLGIVASFMPIINTILDALVNILAPILDAITPIILVIGELIKSLEPVILLIVNIVTDLVNLLLSAGLNLVLKDIMYIIEGIATFISGVLMYVIASLIAIIQGITGAVETIVEVIKKVIQWIANMKTSWQDLGDSIKNIWKNVGNEIKKAFDSVNEKIKTIWASFETSIGSMIQNFLNIWNKIAEFLGLDKMPMFETSFPKKDNSLPKLASGGVLTKPTTVMVGEYSGAKTNPEIVTPENLMREVFVESMLPIAQAIMSGDQQVVGAIEQLANRPINLNGRRVSENIFDDMQQVAIRKGKMMFAR